MASYEITSSVPCLIDGIGELRPGETLVVGEEGQHAFLRSHGYALEEANFPEHISVTENSGTKSTKRKKSEAQDSEVPPEDSEVPPEDFKDL